MSMYLSKSQVKPCAITIVPEYFVPLDENDLQWDMEFDS
jgi:hypothetical protein